MLDSDICIYTTERINNSRIRNSQISPVNAQNILGFIRDIGLYRFL